jgi:AcrR family transcriptional regulator
MSAQQAQPVPPHPAPLEPSEMSANQLARRRRLHDPVITRVADGDDEDMQMRDIAVRADVALGTVYRYFSSKDHLLAAALVAWASELQPPVRLLPAGPPAERLVEVLRRALRAYRRRPAFARVLVHVAHSTDPYASACYRELGPVVFEALGSAISDVEPDTRARVMAVVGAVWYHCLVEWTNGRMSVADVESTLESACRLVLPAGSAES